MRVEGELEMELRWAGPERALGPTGPVVAEVAISLKGLGVVSCLPFPLPCSQNALRVLVDLVFSVFSFHSGLDSITGIPGD